MLQSLWLKFLSRLASHIQAWSRGGAYVTHPAHPGHMISFQIFSAGGGTSKGQAAAFDSTLQFLRHLTSHSQAWSQCGACVTHLACRWPHDAFVQEPVAQASKGHGAAFDSTLIAWRRANLCRVVLEHFSGKSAKTGFQVPPSELPSCKLDDSPERGRGPPRSTALSAESACANCSKNATIGLKAQHAAPAPCSLARAMKQECSCEHLMSLTPGLSRCH